MQVQGQGSARPPRPIGSPKSSTVWPSRHHQHLPQAWHIAGTQCLQAEPAGAAEGSSLTPSHPRAAPGGRESDPLPSAELEDSILGGDTQVWVQTSTLPLTRVTQGNSWGHLKFSSSHMKTSENQQVNLDLVTYFI